MTNVQNKQQSENKFNLFRYVYGRIYAAYVEAGKTQSFSIEDVKTRSWIGIMVWLKRNNHIQSFQFGKTLKDGFKVTFEGFNEKELMYERYLKAIERNILNDNTNALPKDNAISENRNKSAVDVEPETVYVEKLSREDSSTTELNKQVMKELVG